MRPYGVEVIEFPDVADIAVMGGKSCAGQLPGRSGDFHPLSKGAAKKIARRYWKRVARRAGRQEITEQRMEESQYEPGSKCRNEAE